MTKNMTRKGLAIGAAFALTATGLAASPAYASELSLVASAGTTYSVFQSSQFTLNSAITGNTNIANTSAWKWEVVNTSAVVIGVSGEYFDGTAYATSGLATADTGTTKVYAAANSTQTIGKVNKITLDPTTTTTSPTFSVTVRAFSDLDGSGSVTSGDLVSPAQTVTFHKGSEVTGTVLMDTLNAGVAATATLSFDKSINYEMITLSNVTQIFTVNGSAAASGAVTGLNTAKNGIVLTGAAAAAGQIISAKGLWLGFDGDSTLSSASSATSTVSAESGATTAEASISNGENVASGNETVTAGTPDVGITKTLRSGTAALSFDITFKTATAGITAVSPVSLVVTEVASTLIVGDDVTVNGKKLVGTAGAADTVTAFASTDAAGKLTVSVTAANAKAGDNITILATSGTGTVLVNLLWADAAVEDVYVTNALAGDTARTIVKGSAVSLNYVVLDQFDKVWTKTDTNYRLEFTQSGTATAPSALVLSNGSGTLNFTDNSTAASGAYNLTATLFAQTGVGSWTTATVNHVTAMNVVASLTAPAAVAIATPVLDVSGSAIAAGGVPLADVALAALDNRVFDNANAALGVAANSGAKIVATVTSATGANVQGSAVTVSGAGLFFSTTAGGTGVVSKDSIVLNSTSAGVVTVFVYGQTSGAQTITFTAGTVSKTQVLTFASAAANAGTVLTLDVPANALPGSTFKVTGKVVDKYGNPVQIATAGTGTNPTLSVTYSGAGLVSGNLPTTTNAAGEFVFFVLVGSSDMGTSTVTASYDADGTTATIAAIAATSTITIGAAAAAVNTETKVNVGSFNGKLVVYALNASGNKISYKIAGRWVVQNPTSDSLQRFDRLVAARGVPVLVDIYVDGVLKLSKTVVTK